MISEGKAVLSVAEAGLDRRRQAPTSNELLLLRTLGRPRRPWQWAVRMFDLIVATIVLLVAFPVIIGTAFYVFATDRRSPFFVHRRVGRYGRPFGVVKLRTMAVDADLRLRRLLASDPAARAEFLAARKLRDDPRLIPGGALLRKLKVDELPQIVNVLRGDMSIVGPRPVVESELARYGPFGQYVLSVRPGLTGSWQISDADALDYEARIDLDVNFVQQHSLAGVMTVAARTPFRIVRSLGRKEYA